MNLNEYMQPDEAKGLFASAFQPLRQRLHQSAQADQFSSWSIRTGKGNSRYPDYPDISLYRHCMDVAMIAFMLFIYAWKNDLLDELEPEDEEGAKTVLQIILAIAFLHDADKYQLSDSKTPDFEQVQQLYELLEINQWTNLSVDDCFALVSRVENRGKQHALLAPPPTDTIADILADMVSEGDKLTSIASRQGLPAMIANYNKWLPAFTAQYGVPNESLCLWEFKQSPVVLWHLQQTFLDVLYDNQYFPLVGLLEGERLTVSVPEKFDLAAVFEQLSYRLASNTPNIKRNHTNGELNLLHVHDIDTLIEEATDISSYEPRFLTIHSRDWEDVINYIEKWAGGINGLSLLEPGKGKLLLPIAPNVSKGQTVVELAERYQYALAIAAALRVESKGKVFEERLNRLKTWQANCVETDLKIQLPSLSLEQLDKNTRQALYAMQAAIEIQDNEQLTELIEQLQIAFPPPAQDMGTQAIIASLQKQCGLEPYTSSQEVKADLFEGPQEILYASAPKGGTCLLCGLPATQKIETNRMTLAGVKGSAFNNRIGQQKNIWSQTDKNYLCASCLKQQALLCDTLAQNGHRATGIPLLVATPFRGFIKPLKSANQNDDISIINSFMAVNHKDQAWQKVLPWALDISEQPPLFLETVDNDFDSTVNTMYRMASYAAHSGNPVHVFIASQRDSKAAFLFEATPPLIRSLIADLSLPDEPNTVRRDKLPLLVKRLELIRQILTNNGHDVLSAMPAYRWWAVAWLNERLIAQDKFYFSPSVLLAKEVYPMKADQQIETIAHLANQVQRYPGPKASNSDRVFALTTVLNQYETGKKYQQSESVIVAAMAGYLATALDRRDMFAKGKGPFFERCKAFAQEVYNFIETHKKNGQFDARFQRFFLAAYAFLFMEKSHKE
jgi:hypothetical protein